MEPLINELRQECREWAPTAKYQEYQEDEEQGMPNKIGSDAELEFRADIIRRLEYLEALIAEHPMLHPLMGHNRPPEDLVDDENAVLATLTKSVTELKAEFAKHVPDVPEVTRQRNTTSRIGVQIRGVMAHKLDLATDEIAKELGKAVVKVPFWYGVYEAIQVVVQSIGQWMALFGGG